MEDQSLPTMPTGYVYHEPTFQRVSAAYSAAPNGIAGRAKASGLSYFNLTAWMAEFLKSDKIVTGNRRMIDLGTEGVIPEPLCQVYGTCSGCSHSEAATLAACAQYAMTQTGLFPSIYSLAFAYLSGRDRQYGLVGDNGAIPGLTVETFHDIGNLPMCVADELLSLAPCGQSKSQEAICAQYWDSPKRWLDTVRDRLGMYRSRVWSPPDAWSIADCIYTGRPVTYGCSYQAGQTRPGSNGVSSLYYLGGHETLGSGWFVLGGRLGLIKTESWFNAGSDPSRLWPDGRVVIQTDDGPKKLFPGQCALWADEWVRCSVECWSIDAPGSR